MMQQVYKIATVNVFCVVSHTLLQWQKATEDHRPHSPAVAFPGPLCMYVYGITYIVGYLSLTCGCPLLHKCPALIS